MEVIPITMATAAKIAKNFFMIVSFLLGLLKLMRPNVSSFLNYKSSNKNNFVLPGITSFN